MLKTSGWARIAAGLFAGAGILVGHALDYWLLVQDPYTRAHLLAQTGHGYMPGATVIALIAAFGGVVAYAVGANRRPGLRARLSFAHLAVFQVAGFAALESVERVAAGVPAHHLLSRTLFVGLLVQVVVAAAAALVLHGLGRLALRVFRSIVAARRRFARAPRRLTATVVAIARPARRDLSRPYAPRSPPVAA